jgi:hypothetical protein
MPTASWIIQDRDIKADEFAAFDKGVTDSILSDLDVAGPAPEPPTG